MNKMNISKRIIGKIIKSDKCSMNNNDLNIKKNKLVLQLNNAEQFVPEEKKEKWNKDVKDLLSQMMKK